MCTKDELHGAGNMRFMCGLFHWRKSKQGQLSMVCRTLLKCMESYWGSYVEDVRKFVEYYYTIIYTIKLYINDFIIIPYFCVSFGAVDPWAFRIRRWPKESQEWSPKPCHAVPQWMRRECRRKRWTGPNLSPRNPCAVGLLVISKDAKVGWFAMAY